MCVEGSKVTTGISISHVQWASHGTGCSQCPTVWMMIEFLNMVEMMGGGWKLKAQGRGHGNTSRNGKHPETPRKITIYQDMYISPGYQIDSYYIKLVNRSSCMIK